MTMRFNVTMTLKRIFISPDFISSFLSQNLLSQTLLTKKLKTWLNIKLLAHFPTRAGIICLARDKEDALTMSNIKYNRWVMLKKLIAFQVKLTFDAVRDLLLSPVSFVCVLIDMIKNNDEQNSQFQKLMKLGEQTDIWLNLFGQHKQQLPKNDDLSPSNSASSPSAQNPLDKAGQKFSNGNADQFLEKIESLIKAKAIKEQIKEQSAEEKALNDKTLNEKNIKEPIKHSHMAEQDKASKTE